MRFFVFLSLVAALGGVFVSAAGAGGYTDASYLTPRGTVGQPYSHRVEWKPGTGCPPYSYAVVGGDFPAGLSLSSSGVISGVPTREGTFSFYIRQTDQCGPEGEGNSPFKITILPAAPPVPPLVVTSGALPAGEATLPYAAALSASGGGQGTLSWSVTGGQLPPGVTLATDGRIAGVPDAPGSFGFTATVTSGGASASAGFVITVIPGITLNPSAQLPSAEVRVPFTATLASVLGTSGGAPPYRYEPVGGFPFGIGIDSSAGTIFGSPRRPGVVNLTLQAIDANQATRQVTLALNVLPRLQIAPLTLPRARVGKKYRAAIAVTGGKAPLWSISSGALPARLKLSPTTGVISGVPLRSGPSRLTLAVRDTLGAAVSIRITLTVK